MKFFIDTADLNEIQEANDLGVLDGVTTNPSLCAKIGVRDFEGQVKATAPENGQGLLANCTLSRREEIAKDGVQTLPHTSVLAADQRQGLPQLFVSLVMKSRCFHHIDVRRHPFQLVQQHVGSREGRQAQQRYRHNERQHSLGHGWLWQQPFPQPFSRLLGGEGLSLCCGSSNREDIRSVIDIVIVAAALIIHCAPREPDRFWWLVQRST